MEDYGAEQITVLEGLEPVRNAGDVHRLDGSRLHHLVYEVVDNSIDEVLAGHATTIDITLGADGACTVQDDGRGIPCDVREDGEAGARDGADGAPRRRQVW